MSEPTDRPDPDRLLRHVQEDEAKQRRGRLKIFFGFAPGVGKTYRMLEVAQQRELEGIDVVVGVVETHRRFDTANLILGLEVLDRRAIEHRGRTLEEFDLDGALARRPQLLLVDELAHSNVPGSRHGKRWQDVEELLAAGIDVFTTLNVQHVEGLVDLVAQITHVVVRETVPDALLDRADEIELVDVAPDVLLERLSEGKVYLGEQATRAAEHFFKRGNLLALRELALRRTAQRVDADVQQWRERHGVGATWAAGERLLVCVGPAPSSGRLIRAAARIAAGLRCPWVAACVDLVPIPHASELDRERLAAHLALAERLGATVVRLTGASVSETILAHARSVGVTRIVIGKPTHSRLRDRLRGSLLDELVRGSGELEVHVIPGDDAASPPPPVAAGPRTVLPARAWLFAVAGVVGATALSQLATVLWSLPDLEMLFLAVVMVTAIRWGRGPALLSAALGVASYDFFFVPPRFTFAVADGRHVLTFAMMFVLGLAVSELADRLRRQERAAIARAEATTALYALSRALAAADGPAAIAAATVEQAAHATGGACWFLSLDPSGEPIVEASSHGARQLEPPELAVARWALAHGRPAGRGTETLPGAQVTCRPLGGGEAGGAGLALERVAGEAQDFLEALLRQAKLARERLRLGEEAKASVLRVKTEQLRSSLLSAVSHDLRTPLASITGAASSLRDGAGLTPQDRAELLDAIQEESSRLERLVGNLLDMTRLQSGGLVPRREWVPLEELVGAVLTRFEAALEGRQVRTELPAELPMIAVDPLLCEQLLVNLVENALKYTPAGTPLEFVAHYAGGRVELELRDRGPGLPPGDEERLFEKFARGAHGGASGAGLGLAIARGIAEAHGGTLRASNRAEGGAVFALSLPVGPRPPATEEDA